jgi:hypothetical protein
METITIDILNPKAKALLNDLANFELIRIRKHNKNSDLADLLKNFRKNADNTPSMEEITAEVEAVRKANYENKKKTFGATKLMSEQRNQISKNFTDLRSEEIIAYFDKK